MYRHVLMAVALMGLTLAQQPKTPATVAAITSAAAEASSAAKEVLAFERSLDAAFVRGDAAYIDRVSRPDLTVTHGDGWINGGKPSSVDDKKSFLKRVENKLYSVRDLDSVKIEMHGDIAITNGRLILQARTASPDGPGRRCGTSGSTKNAMDTGCGYLIERSTDRPMGQIDSQLANGNSARSSPIPAARDYSRQSLGA